MSIIRNIFDSIGRFFQTEDGPVASRETRISREEVVMIYALAINNHAIAMRVTAGDNEDLKIIDGVLDMLKLATAGIYHTEIYEAIWMIREGY